MNNLICNKQHGFRSGRNCLTQLLHHFDDVLELLTNNADFDSIYLDYAKAFDKVDHKLLIRTLYRYSFNPKIIRWIDSFLSDRKQAVVVVGHLSLLAPIISGVPQGTVLGPILFLIFINDIEHCIANSIIRCFADDTRVSIRYLVNRMWPSSRTTCMVSLTGLKITTCHFIKINLSMCVIGIIGGASSLNFLLSVNSTSTPFTKTSRLHLYANYETSGS